MKLLLNGFFLKAANMALKFCIELQLSSAESTKRIFCLVPPLFYPVSFLHFSSLHTQVDPWITSSND